MNLTMYVKALKKYASDKKISNEDFLNALLSPYINAADILDKNGNPYWLDKSRTSLILTGNDDIPEALRHYLTRKDIVQKTRESFGKFIDQYLVKDEMDNIVAEIEAVIVLDKTIYDKGRLLDGKDDPSTFLADVLLEALRISNKGGNPTGEILRNGAFSVKVVYDDILKYAFPKRSNNNKIVVIPIDTAFHTHVTWKYEKDPYPQVSPNSIHGKWLIKWGKAGESVEDLPDRIQNSINTKCLYETDSEKYPIGTIAAIERGDSVFYLLAISEFDENNNAHSTKDNLDEALENLFDYYDKYGEANDIYIPLLGTGKSRMGLSLQESFDSIVGFLRSNPSKIQGNIFIVIQKEVENQVDIRGGKQDVL